MAEYTITFSEDNDTPDIPIKIFSDITKQSEVTGSPITTDSNGDATIDLADGTYYGTASLLGVGAVFTFTVDGEAKTVNFERKEWQVTVTAGTDEFDVSIDDIRVATGETVTVDWGDGATTAISSDTTNIAHQYASAGTYTVTFLGTEHFTRLSWHSAAYLSGDLSGWGPYLPSGLTDLRLYSNDFSGDLSGWGPYLPSGLERLYLDRNEFSGDLSGWGPYLPSSLTHLYLYSNDFSGDLSGWGPYLPSSLTHLYLYSNEFSGDLSGWGQYLLSSLAYLLLYSNEFSGDLSGWGPYLPSGLTDLRLYSNDFSGDLSGWGPYLPSSLTRLRLYNNEFTGYSDFLINAARLETPPPELELRMDNYKYKLGLPAASKAYLESAHTWAISDDGDTGRYYDVPTVAGGKLMRYRPRIPAFLTE